MEPIVTGDNGRTVSIISYFTIIGWLIAYFGFHKNNKTSLGSYQLRQTLLLHIVFFIIRFGLSFVLASIGMSPAVLSLYYFFRLIELGFLALWIVGLIGAINGEKRPIPLLGEWAQTMFPGI